MDSENADKDIVYGFVDIDARLVFLPRTEAVAFRSELDDVYESRTWGELRQRLRRDGLYEDALGWFEEAQDEREPDEASFDSEQFPGASDGDWPLLPEMLMHAWFPEDLAERFGEVITTTLNGDYLALDVERCDELVAELRARGYRCTRDNELMSSFFN